MSLQKTFHFAAEFATPGVVQASRLYEQKYIANGAFLLQAQEKFGENNYD